MLPAPRNALLVGVHSSLGPILDRPDVVRRMVCWQCSVRMLSRWLIGWNFFRTAANTCCDRLFCGRTACACALRHRFDGVGSLESLDLCSEFGSVRRRLGAFLCRPTGKPDPEPVAQRRQFGQVRLMQERLAETGLIIPQLSLCDLQVLTNPLALKIIAGGKLFQRVEDSPRP